MSSTDNPPSFTHLMCSHLALWTLVWLKALVECSFNGLHFSRNGLEGLLIMLLSLQSFIQTFLFLADLRWERRDEKDEIKVKGLSGVKTQVFSFLSSLFWTILSVSGQSFLSLILQVRYLRCPRSKVSVTCRMSQDSNVLRNASLLKMRSHIDFESTFGGLRLITTSWIKKSCRDFVSTNKYFWIQWWTAVKLSLKFTLINDFVHLWSNVLGNLPHSWGFPKISASHPSWQCWSSSKGHTAPGWGLGLECYDPVQQHSEWWFQWYLLMKDMAALIRP